VDCRILPCYPLETVRKEIARVVAAVEKKHGVSIEWSEPQSAESPATSPDAPVVAELSRAIKAVYGVTPRAVGVGGGTVAASLRKAGFDAVVWSRLDETAHQPNEYCRIENLSGDACVMAALMLGVADKA